LPDGFSYVKDVNPNIKVDLKYAGTDNFSGSIVAGYYSISAAILSNKAAEALSEVQKHLEENGLGLLIYDAYRPQKASEYFHIWSQSDDEMTKEAHYPNTPKVSLNAEGYIASRSGHSRGSIVDVTIIDLATGEPLDMGCEFDFFDELAWYGSPNISVEQAQNREILKVAMERFGFSSYNKEWWHFILKNEPFPETFFDFDVR
jgi:D-alanyl-D-alanine dipeptidase